MKTLKLLLRIDLLLLNLCIVATIYAFVILVMFEPGRVALEKERLTIVVDSNVVYSHRDLSYYSFEFHGVELQQTYDDVVFGRGHKLRLGDTAVVVRDITTTWYGGYQLLGYRVVVQ